MGTTASGYPYPEDTDPLYQGAQATKALATAIQTRLRASAAGSVNVAVNTSTTLFSAPVTFPAGRFTAPPLVVATVTHSWYVASVSNVTATGCTISVRNVTTGRETTTRTVHWQAMGAG